MSQQASEPGPWMPAVLRGLSRGVRAGRLSRWRAIGVVALLVWSGLAAAGFFALLCYLVALMAVGISVGTADPVSLGDSRVLAVAAGLGVTTIAVVAVGSSWLRRREAAHRARMRHWADANGWVYQPRSSLLSSRWSVPGTRGSTRATDVLTRSRPQAEVASFTLASRFRARRRARHAVMVSGPRRLPALSLQPMTGRDRVERIFGGQDIAVESFDVNERWRARCADERYAHEVLHPRLLERLGSASLPGLCLLVQGPDVVVHVPGPTDPANVQPMADLTLDLASLLPAYLADDYPPLPPEAGRRERRQSPRRMR